MITIDPSVISQMEIQKWLSGGVAPRPIALVSTISEDGKPNLSPFSFFNAFGSNPPVIAFSASRRGRDNTVKDTYNNIMATKECVVNAITYDMVEQINLASSEFGSEVDEFVKSGLTGIKSDLVNCLRVKESPFQMECKLIQMVHLGEKNGSGNLAICEVIRFHVDESIISNNEINPDLIDLVGRNGGAYYTRASGSAIFSLKKPAHDKAIGYESLPDYIRESSIYSANNIARFAMNHTIPTIDEANNYLEQFPIVESDKSTFMRFKRTNNYKAMISIAKYFESQSMKNVNFYYEEIAKIASEANDDELAINLAVYTGKF